MEMRFSEHLDGGGETNLEHGCKLGLERIVSKRRDFCVSVRSMQKLDQSQKSCFVCSDANSGWKLVRWFAVSSHPSCGPHVRMMILDIQNKLAEGYPCERAHPSA